MPTASALRDDAISVVIPVLDAARHLRPTLEALRSAEACGAVAEIIVVDGGSRDDGAAIARSLGARVLPSAPGRGGQLRLGAAAASAPWLFFLHADTIPDPGWVAATRAIRSDERGDAAAVFRLRLDDRARAARIIERGVAWRTRALGLPYGDQGLLISRRFHDALGGYADIPLMEDVDLVRRIGRRRLRLLDHAVTTSAERYRRDGYAPRVLRNLSILTLYLLGAAPARLARLYG